MKNCFFKRLRERQEQREIEKARREGFKAGRRHAQVVGRAEWAAAALATAEQTGDPALIQKASENALAAAAELNEMNRNDIAENERLAELVRQLEEAKQNG